MSTQRAAVYSRAADSLRCAESLHRLVPAIKQKAHNARPKSLPVSVSQLILAPIDNIPGFPQNIFHSPEYEVKIVNFATKQADVAIKTWH